MLITKEATYVFNYRGAERRVDIFVDSVEGRRYASFPGSYSGDVPTLFNSIPLNYRGTGNSYQEINAELVGENIVSDTPDYQYIELLFRLPDVNAYVLANYYYNPAEYESGILSIDKFLDKLVN